MQALLLSYCIPSLLCLIQSYDKTKESLRGNKSYKSTPIITYGKQQDYYLHIASHHYYSIQFKQIIVQSHANI